MKKKKVHWTELEPEEKLKYEIAQEIGLLDKVLELGWENLSARETGKIGGLVTRHRKAIKFKQDE